MESPTMAMANSVAQLIKRNLRHSSGFPVDCVIADTCIGGPAESAQTAFKFAREGVCAIISVTPCWCYGAETIDMDPYIPKAIWGFNGTERPGAVYLASALAAHNQKGLPAFGIYGRDVQDIGDSSRCSRENSSIYADGNSNCHYARKIISGNRRSLYGDRGFDSGSLVLRELSWDASSIY
jgi:L-fucose isomerase-like protein